ncbi:hypothetical protein WDD9_006557 [Paenibacillus melissococcoides]|uniref:hypothetical protein n=1 Tax=Paenibacillus melissococcoides TaxID=2912268 RepID=UPI0021C2C810|nr:hypothetical protein [Paenibacillus melissococcoides]CAH8721357.1 hypothetical protein WDD9_006249 [Paenibacillus melissococcoides]CAH8721973.1 hypothetical protein WDD9_006557 [Paenibacillus melissococcoides]
MAGIRQPPHFSVPDILEEMLELNRLDAKFAEWPLIVAPESLGHLYGVVDDDIRYAPLDGCLHHVHIAALGILGDGNDGAGIALLVFS